MYVLLWNYCPNLIEIIEIKFKPLSASVLHIMEFHLFVNDVNDFFFFCIR